MLGAIIGDIAGSRFEFNNCKSKDFDLFTAYNHPTDDSNMTLAVAQALLQCTSDHQVLSTLVVQSMQDMGRRYPFGFGARFSNWVHLKSPQPYGSWGNGAGMRVSPCAYAARTLEEALALSDTVTSVTHNHPEGIRGARAITACIFLARSGADKDQIRDFVQTHYYPLDFTLDQIRPTYTFDVSCQGSCPQAIEAFLESTSFEDAVRNAVSIGGDSDTIAAMAGSMAQAFYGIPEALRASALDYLDEIQKAILQAFELRFGSGPHA